MNNDVSESTLIAGFLKWANVNGIPLHELCYSEIEEFIMRYLTAAS